MEIAAVHSQLQQGKLERLYVFYGEETVVQSMYVQQIIKLSGLSRYSADTVLDVYKRLKHKTILQTACCYIVYGDAEFLFAEVLWDNIQLVLGDNILILRYDTIDKRTRFYKRFADHVVEFAPLQDVALKKYIKKQIDLSDDNCETLINVCEHNYGRILLEIDKIKRYVDARKD